MSTDKLPYKSATPEVDKSAYENPPAEPCRSRTRRLIARVRRMIKRWYHDLFKGCGVFAFAVVALTTAAACAPTTPPPAAVGSFSIEWLIQNQDRLFTTCERVGATMVRFTLTSASGDPHILSFPCAARSTTSTIAPGAYEVGHELLNATGVVIARTGRQSLTVTAGHLTKLLPAIFVASTPGAAPPASSSAPAQEDGSPGPRSS